MNKLLIGKVFAGSFFLAAAVGAPAAAWLSGQPLHADRLATFSGGDSLLASARAHDDVLKFEVGEVVEIIKVDRLVIAAAPGHATKERNCYDHNSQTLAKGKVRICDVARSSNVRSAKVLSDIGQKRRSQRDLPSPSGLFQ